MKLLNKHDKKGIFFIYVCIYKYRFFLTIYLFNSLFIYFLLIIKHYLITGPYIPHSTATNFKLSL